MIEVGHLPQMVGPIAPNIWSVTLTASIDSIKLLLQIQELLIVAGDIEINLGPNDENCK